MNELTYEKYNEKSLHVKGDKDKYSALIRGLGGKWNSRLKKGSGWIVPIAKEPELQALLKDLFPKKDETEVELESIQTSAKPRKEQKIYHRAQSSPTSESSSEEEKKEKKEIQTQRKKSKKMKKNRKPKTPSVSSSSSSDSDSDSDDEGIYNRSNSRSSSSSDSSSSSSSSSSDDFPSHSQPKETDRYAKIATKIKDMQRKVYDLDLKSRKR